MTDLSQYGTPEHKNLSSKICYCAASGLPMFLTYDPLDEMNSYISLHWIFTCPEKTFRELAGKMFGDDPVNQYRNNREGAQLFAFACLYRFGAIEIKNTPVVNWKEISIGQYMDIVNLYSLFFSRRHQKTDSKLLYDDGKDPSAEVPLHIAYNGKLDFTDIISNLQVYMTQRFEYFFWDTGTRGNENKNRLPENCGLSRMRKDQLNQIEFVISFWDALEVEIGDSKESLELFPQEERESFYKILSLPIDKAILYADSARRIARRILEGGFAQNENGSANFNAYMVLNRIGEIDKREREYYEQIFGEKEGTETIVYGNGISLEISNIPITDKSPKKDLSPLQKKLRGM